MSNSLSGKIFNFLTTSPLEHITAFSVIFQAMEEEPLIKQDALRNIVNNAVNLATNTYSNNILAQNKLLMVSMQSMGDPFNCNFPDSTLEIVGKPWVSISRLVLDSTPRMYGGTLTLILQVSEVYMWKAELLTMCRPRRDGNFFDVAYEGVRSLRDIEISKTIESPISREEIAKNMRELKSKLKGKSSQLAVEMCQLLEKVNIDNLTWQKPLASQVISDDSDLVQDLTLMARQSFMKLAQRMQATLPPTIQEKCKTFIKDFRIENIDEAERQKREEKLNELIFTESSRLICIDSKEENDKIKLWREMNDGMAYVHKGCRPDKDEFGILGIQVAGEMMHLSVLIKDINDVQRLYHLQSIIIPVQPTDAEILTHFVEALLVLRNVTIVNNSLLFHASRSKSNRLRRKSSTVSSDKE
ncbi:hypothetical protein RhiirC2_799214 [Rhizophagus irregularis]|uniref:Uncharacterized protein n=1 Tax=Rhizophagus irregularis TaxID=588596 RepID=A0A2N1M5B6_9GLOM|nr:hypothetical protein RhiirC2_799214 [Rhizophagus irregularis]